MPIPDTAATVAVNAPKLANGVIEASSVTPLTNPGCRVFVQYNGPTDQLRGVCAGMAVLEPGASPHEPHIHPEEEFMIIASGSGEINTGGKITKVSAGAMQYVAGNVLHGVMNTGKVPLTFYWSKWLARGF